MFDKAYAKINLSLDIKNEREDGYHNLESIFLPLNFYDELYITKNDEMVFECNRPYVKFNESNTVYKAIELFKKEFNINDNYHIKLVKSIPLQSGMAGGSTDGASALRILIKMYNLNLTDEKIKELCLKIGADVYFTFYNKPALVTGIGDELKFIDVKDDYYVLIVKPRYGVSTKECYEKLDCNDCPHPNILAIEKALKEGEDFIPYLGNSMEPVAISLLNSIDEVKQEMLNNGALFALMSGSGSSVFTMSKDFEEIKKISNLMNKKKYFVRYTKVLKK